MYDCLLVPLDGSPLAEQALPLALGIGRLTNAKIELLRVYVPYAFRDANAGWLPADAEMELILQQRGRAYLDDVAKRFAGNSPKGLKHALVIGQIFDSILAHAASTRADLIVMTTHARGPLSRFWLGSVADDLLRRSPLPILLVRPRTPGFSSPAEPGFRHILIPLDGSAFAEQVVERAVALSTPREARYTLLRVVEECPPAAVETIELDAIQKYRMFEEAQISAQAYLESVAARLRTVTSAVQIRTLVAYSTPEAILAEAEASGCDLIALATHGRHGLQRLFLGSVADKVVRGATVPVLVYRAAEPPSTSEPAR